MRKIKGLMIMLAIVLMIITQANTQTAKAASKYIKVEEYIEYIVKQMKWDKEKASDKSYIDIAIDKGLLKKDDFKSYTSYLTRTDAAVIANRLDELINLKYGYPQDVYDFLKDCTQFENKLFYTTEGIFYPEGATKETYPAVDFYEDVVTPIIEGYFISDKSVKRGLKVEYKYIYDNSGNITKRYMEIGVKPEGKYDLHMDPVDENSDIIKAWNMIHDHGRKEKAVLEKRISDIKDIPKTKREDVASVVAKGIIKGYSNGIYVQNREFRGKKKITASGAKNVINLVLNVEKRAQISPDGQLIRTTKLPKNYKNYEYILECFPNKYYEMKHSFVYLTDYLSGKIRDDEYAYPKEVDYDFLYDKFYHDQLSLETGKYGHYDATLLNTEKYLKHIFDVDYRTVNNKWKNGLASSLSFYSWDDDISKRIERYVENIKKNHTVVELDRVAIDPGTIYECRDYLYVRAYVKYRITTDDMSVPTNQMIYNANLKNIKKGEWREDIFDVFIEYRSESNVYKWAPSAFISLSNWAYRDSFE